MADDSPTRATLLERLREGGAAMAWEDFFARYWRLIYATAARQGCSEHTAEEIVQEVMLTVFEKRDVFRYDPARGRFRDWLRVVVLNAVRSHRRRPAERMRAWGGHADALAEQKSAEPSPETAWEAAFEEAVLGVLLDTVRRQVAPETYQAFELLAIGDLPGAQVAKITGLSRNAVYLARRRVLRRLRELGADYRDGGALNEQLRRALQALPDAAAQRVVTTRVQESMRSREGLSQ